MRTARSPGSAADIRRWCENRKLANALEVRDLATTWGSPAQSIRAALELLDVYATLHGWPPPDDPIDREQDLAAWDRLARLRRPYIR